MTNILRIRPEVARCLGYYVYIYVDPRSSKPFYVGKGKGARALSHLSNSAESHKRAVIEELLADGKEPRIEILAHGLKDEVTAYQIEAAIIDLFEIDSLTNKMRGRSSIQFGRVPLEELSIQYCAKPVTIKVPALLIRINRLYRHNMESHQLYEATRGTWKLGPRRNAVRYAFAVFEGVVREVYRIEQWHPAGSTPYTIRDAAKLKRGRWEFSGGLAEDAIRKQYRERSVAAYFQQGQRSPTTYVKC